MSRPLGLTGVPNRKQLLAEAERLGCKVEYLNGGEVRVTGPYGTRINMNNRRKDGNKKLVVLLRRLQAKERPITALYRAKHFGKGA